MTSGTHLRRIILARSTERFLTRGFSRVTMSALSAELGISKKTLYRHFRSKHELVRACMEEQLRRVDQRLERVRGRDMLERLREVLGLVSEFFARISPAFIEDLYRHAPELWHWIEERRRIVVFDRFREIVAEGRDLGVVRADLDPEVVTAILRTVGDGLLNPEQMVRQDGHPLDVFRTFVRLMMGGMLTEEGRARFDGEAS